MSFSRKKILIVGLFLSEKNKGRILRTAADQLAELLRKNSYEVVTVSKIVNQVARLLDTIITVVLRSPTYRIAIVPLYGGFKSFIWESVTTTLLKLFRKKVIVVVHGGSIPDKMKQNAKKYLRTLRSADVVVCPSGFLLTALEQHGIKSVKIENVVNLQDYRFQNKENFRPRILWMRTIEDIYNPEMAVRVAGILAKKYPDFKLVMAGYDRGSLQLVTDLAKELNVLDKIEFPGYISNGQKNEYAQELDIYICTNRIDNAPVTFVEMMALGLPVVSVNIGGIPHLVQNGFNGLLVDLDDDEAMANCISSIIEQPELGKLLVKNALEYSKQFDEQPVLEKWKKVFNQLGS